MDDTLIVDDLDQLKALADPLRRRILRAVCCSPATTKQVANQLGEKPTRLYHHVDLLEEVGLVKLVETRQKRGTIEKYYQACARKFVVDHELFHVDPDQVTAEVQTTLVNALQANLTEARDYFATDAVEDEACCETIFLYQEHFRLTDKQAQELAGRLSAWLADLENRAEEEGPSTYSLVVTFFPVRKQFTTED